MKKILVPVMLVALAAAVSAQDGTIQEMTGTVELRREGAADFVAAKTGDRVAANTIVSTGFRSTAVIAVGSAVINVQPLTRLALTEIAAAQNRETTAVDLQAGRLRIDVTPPSGTSADFTIRTPSTTASVRGTRFRMNTLGLSVERGTVAFRGKGRGGTRRVGGGGNSRVDPDGRAEDPLALAAGALSPPPPVSGPPGGGGSGGGGGNAAPQTGSNWPPDGWIGITIVPDIEP